MNIKPLVSIVIPVLNEELSIPEFLMRMQGVQRNLPNFVFEIIFINDGSTDKTLEVLLRCKNNFDNIIVVDLSRNFGKEAALSAGLDQAKGDAVIPIDVDLQDPPELIADLLEMWMDGYEVVLAKRIDRKSDHWAKSFTSHFFYKLHNFLSRVKIEENAGDFRLMDRKVVNSLSLLRESNRFMKGLFAWAGYKTTFVGYTRAPRSFGRSKFNALGLWKFAVDGITGFSNLPLQVWTYMGALIALFAFLYTLFILFRVIFFGIDTPGYASLLVTITFLGGIQLIGIGVLGEYIGRIYTESKRRPIYLISNIY